MSAYYRFGASDIIHYSLSTSPKSYFASGSNGWRGSTGTSGSISLYGGIRSRETADTELTIQPVYNLETYTIDGKVTLSASYPFTGSISYVKVQNKYLDRDTGVYDGLWGEEHFSPIMNLYDYYRKINTDYVTSSNDFYMLFFDPQRGAQNRVSVPGTSLFDSMNSEYAIEAMIKPLTISGSSTNYPIFFRNTAVNFYITGSTGRLALSASDGSGYIRTSSFALTEDRWQHVAWRTVNGTGSFTVNMLDAGEYTDATGTLDNRLTAIIRVGNVLTPSTDIFHGFMFDLKVWNKARTWAQMSSSFDRTMLTSGSEQPLLYLRFNDGPKATNHGIAAGSGAFDYGVSGSHATLTSFNGTNPSPIWHPNDNFTFITTKTQLTSSADELMVVHIPSMYYGRQIATGSVRLECNAFLSQSLQRVLVDDGRGGLYLSGSATSSSLDTREEYSGVMWNKVGNVFYSEGLIVIKDPALLDFGLTNSNTPLQNDILQVRFSGLQSIPTKVFMCRVNGAAANSSNNPSFSALTSSGKYIINPEKPITRITAVGLYNEERKLVAVAKLAQPVRNREKDKINIKLKMDF